MSQLFPSEILKNSSENYFTEQSTTSQIIYVSAILFLVVSFGLLPIVKVQVTTQSEGIIRSGYEDNPISAVVSGEVLSFRIIDNQFVNIGDTLLLISTDRIDEEIKLLNFQQGEENLLLTDLNMLLLHEKTDFKSAVCKQDYLAYMGKLAEQKTQLLQSESEFKLTETLFSKGITPKHDFEKTTHQFEFEKTRYSLIQAQQLTLWQEKLKATKLSLFEHSARILQLKNEKKQYCLTAPIPGTIADCAGIKTGNFILSGQQIARITPESNLLVECLISPSDIGLIENGMPASFQFHAFNYNLWGTATGKVNEISNNVVSVNNQPFFRIKCQLDQQFLQLKNGYKGNLKKGMTLTGRFKVSERTLFQLLYDKADDWLNPKLSNG